MPAISYLVDFYRLFYPKLCLACWKHPPFRPHHFCLRCHYRLPRTEFHLHRENEFTDRFWGRFPLMAGAALYYFKKKGLTQELIHHFKYRGKKEIGLRTGETYGHQLKQSPHFQGIEAIIPVPLFWKKEKRRGFNQSALFAQGLSTSMEVPFFPQGMVRLKDTETQTRKTQIQRLENVHQTFAVTSCEMLEGKNILLVDDVLTTGATLESCALELLKIPGVTISMATMAIAVI